MSDAPTMEQSPSLSLHLNGPTSVSERPVNHSALDESLVAQPSATSTLSTSNYQHLPSDQTSDVEDDTYEFEFEKGQGLVVSKLRSGFCYDTRMRYHSSLLEEDQHPEDPKRIQSIHEWLVKAGLINKNGIDDSSHTLQRVFVKPASHIDVSLVHSDTHWRFIKDTAGKEPSPSKPIYLTYYQRLTNLSIRS